MTRDGGASLNDDGLPFLITQMKRNSKFQTNNTQNLRADRFDINKQRARMIIKPKKRNYILDKINANEACF